VYLAIHLEDSSISFYKSANKQTESLSDHKKNHEMMFTCKEQTIFPRTGEGNQKLTLIKIISSWPFLFLLPTIRNLEEQKRRQLCQNRTILSTLLCRKLTLFREQLAAVP